MPQMCVAAWLRSRAPLRQVRIYEYACARGCTNTCMLAHMRGCKHAYGAFCTGNGLVWAVGAIGSRCFFHHPAHMYVHTLCWPSLQTAREYCFNLPTSLALYTQTHTRLITALLIGCHSWYNRAHRHTGPA